MFGAQSPLSPCVWALPGSGVSVTSSHPTNAWTRNRERGRSCWSSAFPGEPECQPRCSRKNQKPISSQRSSSARRCSQHQPAPLGTSHTTSSSISWLLQPPRIHGVALEGMDAQRLEVSPEPCRAAQHAPAHGFPLAGTPRLQQSRIQPWRQQQGDEALGMCRSQLVLRR